MKFAPVLPARLYPFFDTGDYHLVQAHLVLQHPEVVDWLCACAASHHTIILDNGVIESGEPQFDATIDLAETVWHRTHHQVDAIVCPDKFNEYQETIDLWNQYARECIKYAQRVMAVPHGSCEDEYINCALEMAQTGGMKSGDIVFGIPKVIDNPCGNRWFVTMQIAHHLDIPYSRFHWLGVWSTMRYVVEVARYQSDIAGLDTTLPAAHALIRTQFFSECSKKAEIRGDMWNVAPQDLDAASILFLHRNIARVRSWISPRT